MLEALAIQLIQAKQEEQTAKDLRIYLEEKIAELVPGPETGQKTVKLPDGTKITVERGLNYKADLAAIDKLFDDSAHDLPNTWGELVPPTKMRTTRELDAKGYEWYRVERPDVFRQLAPLVTATPKKVAVTIKVKE